MSTPTRVVVIDDHTSIREAAEGGRWPGLVLVASYLHTEAFLSRYRGRADYDVIVLDLQLNPQPGQTGPPPAIGTAAIRSLRNAGHHPIVLYTGIVADGVIAACLAAGADGAVSKNSPNDEISRAVVDVGGGHLAVDRALAGALKRLDAGRHAGGLSVQQGRVITLLAQGLNQDAIAASIGVSTRKSVENYLRDAIFKLSQPEWDLPTAGVTGSLAVRRAAAALGLSDGLVRLEDLEEARRDGPAQHAMPPGGVRGFPPNVSDAQWATSMRAGGIAGPDRRPLARDRPGARRALRRGVAWAHGARRSSRGAASRACRCVRAR